MRTFVPGSRSALARTHLDISSRLHCLVLLVKLETCSKAAKAFSDCKSTVVTQFRMRPVTADVFENQWSTATSEQNAIQRPRMFTHQSICFHANVFSERRNGLIDFIADVFHLPEVLVPQAAGRELRVLQGSLQAWGRRGESGSWLRLPPGEDARLHAGTSGVMLYVKSTPANAWPLNPEEPT